MKNMEEIYCPVCRTRLKTQDHCDFCGADLEMEITITDEMIPEFIEKVKGIG